MFLNTIEDDSLAEGGNIEYITNHSIGYDTDKWFNDENEWNGTKQNNSGEKVCNPHPHTYPGFEWFPANVVLAGRSMNTFLSIYMFLLLVGSTFLNGAVIVATSKFKAVRAPLNYIIVNLAFADLLSGIVGGIVITLTSAEGYFYFGNFACYLEGFLISFFSLAGINSIAVMALERYMVICKPFGPQKVTNRQAGVGVVFTWIYSIAWNMPLVIFPDGIIPEGVGINCAPNWFADTDSMRLFLVLYFVFCFLIPLSLIGGCYAMVLTTIHTLNKNSSVSGSKNPEGEVARMVILMVSAFLVAWLPYAIITMVLVMKPGTEIPTFWQTAPGFFAKSSLIYNPMIYIGFNRQFRDCVVRMFFGGRNPWQIEVADSPTTQVSQVTTIGSNKVGPA